jgi:predicted PurR-regulated permease PerM
MDNMMTKNNSENDITKTDKEAEGSTRNTHEDTDHPSRGDATEALKSPKPFQLNYAHYFLFALLLLVFIACYQIIKPYLHPIILAIILTIIFSPIHRKIETAMNGKQSLAALISCILLTLVVVLPIMVMLVVLIQQGIQSFHAMYDWIAAGKFSELLKHPILIQVTALVEKYLPDVQKIFPDVDLKSIKVDQMLLGATSSIGKTLINQGGHLVGNITGIVGKFFLMMFAFFFFIRDEAKIFSSVQHLLPLSTSQEDRIMEKIRTVAKSALLGTLVTAIAQGAAGGIAFWIAGLPGLFWGMVMAFAALIPLVGTALIWIPAAGYLFISGQWGYGLFVVIWCVVVVGMIDNIVRPLFMQGAADMSPLLIFFAILGGINYFGLIGLLYGPLIFGVAMVLVYIYSLEFSAFLDQQDSR